jgi:hypothetical protein
MQAQKRRRWHNEPVPPPVREQSRKRRDERPISRAKPRSLLPTSQNRELVPQQHQLHVLGELGPTAADEQPQNCGEGKVGKGEERQAILPDPANWFGGARPLRRSEASGTRARVKLKKGRNRSDRAEPSP